MAESSTRVGLGTRRSSTQISSEGAPRVIVAGATGFAGALAAHLLWRHPRFELTAVTGRSEVGRRLDELYPRYRVPLTDRAARPRRARPDRRGRRRLPTRRRGANRRRAARARRAGRRPERRFPARFDSATYERWYGEHPRPDLLEEAVYGLTELHRERIAGADIVANPGLLPDGVAARARPARPGGADRRRGDRRQAGHLGRRAHFRRDHAPVDGRREHPPLQGRRTPSHARDRGAARVAARAARRDRSGGGARSRPISCRSTRASLPTAT